ncbi:hypothetical protein K523DRAFT_413485 [Schizophyllum commune Tattone D]|nr:hypothetical protein K523DRAFT_413485 [Schizophyllum commune Tattone D]
MSPTFLRRPSAISTSTLATPYTLRSKAQGVPKIIGNVDRDRLSFEYAWAYTDFNGRPPCIYKSGPSWPTHSGSLPIVRELGPASGHSIGAYWPAIGHAVGDTLDSKATDWRSIDLASCADVNSREPFCPILLFVGVCPSSLVFGDAVLLAAAAKELLAKADIHDIEVAFVESVVVRAATNTPTLISPLRTGGLLHLSKPLSPILALSIAPLDHPHAEGTGGLYYGLVFEGRNRIALLTCAHVVLPPSIYDNTGMTVRNSLESRRRVISPGKGAFDVASSRVEQAIVMYEGQVKSSEKNIEFTKFKAQHTDGELDPPVPPRLAQFLSVAKSTLEDAKALHDALLTRDKAEQRVIGQVLYASVRGASPPHGYNRDFALVLLDENAIDLQTFPGNLMFVGDKLGTDGLLRAGQPVTHAELESLTHPDIDSSKFLKVVKHGRTTGVTFGHAHGYDSVIRDPGDYGEPYRSCEIVVYPDGASTQRLADPGDSGSIFLDLDGRIVGMLTGVRESQGHIICAYLTPYWWLEQQLKAEFPSLSRYSTP